MPKTKKQLLKIFVAVIVVLTCSVYFLSLVKTISAAEPILVNLQVPIKEQEKTATNYANYIKTIYEFGVAGAGVIAVVMIMVGGIMWVVAAGNPTKIGQAKEYITNAIIGILLVLGSYTLLQTINPELVKLRVPVLKSIAKKGDLGTMASGCQNKDKCADDEIESPFACGNIEKTGMCCCSKTSVPGKCDVMNKTVFYIAADAKGKEDYEQSAEAVCKKTCYDSDSIFQNYKLMGDQEGGCCYCITCAEKFSNLPGGTVLSAIIDSRDWYNYDEAEKTKEVCGDADNYDLKILEDVETLMEPMSKHQICGQCPLKCGSGSDGNFCTRSSGSEGKCRNGKCEFCHRKGEGCIFYGGWNTPPDNCCSSLFCNPDTWPDSCSPK